MRNVFEDPTGRRRRRVYGFLGVSAFALSVVATIFALSLAFIPLLAPAPAPVHNSLPEAVVLHQRQARERAALTAGRRVPASHRGRHAAPDPAAPLAVAFYVPWEDAGLESFRARAHQLDVIVPAWLRLADDGVSLDERDFDLASNPRNAALIEAARRSGVAIVPLISNAREGVFNPASVSLLLASPERRQRLIRNLLDWVRGHGFQGINLDFELVPAREWPALGQFVQQLAADFRNQGLTVTADLEASLPAHHASAVVNACDWVVLMLYDEHSEDGEAGPIASLDWASDVWERWTDAFPASRIVMGIGSFGYDWPSRGGPAQSLSFDEVMSAASENRDSESPAEVIRVDPSSRNPFFSYEDENGAPHAVWFLDAMTAFNQWRLTQASGARGLALWVLGEEDPAIWSFLGRSSLGRAPDPAPLGEISFPYQVNFRGAGEILRVVQRPRKGERTFTTSPAGDILSWTYRSYAFPFLIEKSGFRPRQLVLTFDDGPDPEFTPRIIEVLQRLRAPAVFFVLGEAAVRYPRLLNRMAAAGFEIGSHSYSHPDLGEIAESHALLELNATQRALEAILGRSTRLFRPPYNADSQPETAAQVRPVELADRLHYVTVGENIDPTDWNPRIENPDGSFRPKTGHDIALSVIHDIETRAGSGEEGNVILLHDAGGDRTATVAALEEMIPELRRRGYEFVSLSQLLGKPRDELMPPIRSADLGLVGIDRIVFGAAGLFEAALSAFFYAAIFIGAARAVFLAVMAWFNRHPRAFTPPSSPLPAGVLIAAYNEEKVISATLRSVLASRYPLQEIIVIDDGSTDGTAAEVEREFGDHPLVRLIRKPNGGKASALNAGLRAAKSDILVCLDADTVLHPDAAGLLVRHFDRPNVAAVAGNVRVGNAGSVFTVWQSIEYTTSQNLDRRAQERLDCITVVPGAIGAWRRDAVLAAGGYHSDTLAEDTDLTWRLRLAGHRIENEPLALSFTEAPDSASAFFRQRFRWAYGTLQCLWKHRAAFGRHGWFGRFAIPQLWLSQVVFQVLAPIVDLVVLLSLLTSLWVAFHQSGSIELDRLATVRADLARILAAYGLFYLLEFASAWLAYSLERRPKRELWYLFLQRVVYRQIMYAVIWKALWQAFGGGAARWNKLRRLGTVRPASD